MTSVGLAALANYTGDISLQSEYHSHMTARSLLVYPHSKSDTKPFNQCHQTLHYKMGRGCTRDYYSYLATILI